MRAQDAVAEKLDEVAAAIERMEGMAMQSASNGAKAQSEVSPRTPASLASAAAHRMYVCRQAKDALDRLEGMSMSSATNLAKFEKKITDRTESLEAMLMQAAMNTSKFEKKIDSRTEGCDRALASALGPLRPC